MNQNTLNTFANFCKGNRFQYVDADTKKMMHSKGRAVLRQIAKGLGLEKGSFDIRSNMAGIACSGEITLHSDNLYLQIQPDSFLFMEGKEILFRSCNGRKDFTGGTNYFMGIQDLKDSQLVLRKLKPFVCG